MTTLKPVVRQADEGERLWFAGGGVFTMKASAEETGKAFVMLEDRVVRGKTTPLHLHPDEDEVIYVLEGEMLAHFDGENHRVGERGLFFAPRGVPHAFLITSDTAHLLAFQTPGTGWGFYESITEPATSDADASRPADFARLQEAARTSSTIEILGPPPFDPAMLQAVPTAS